jgi:Tfp pilus assembly protein PilP
MKLDSRKFDLFILCICFCFTNVCFSSSKSRFSSLRDPFFLPAKRKKKKKKSKIKLVGVVKSGDKFVALTSYKDRQMRLTKGEEIGDFKVYSISMNSVILKSGKEKISLFVE